MLYETLCQCVVRQREKKILSHLLMVTVRSSVGRDLGLSVSSVLRHQPGCEELSRWREDLHTLLPN